MAASPKKTNFRSSLESSTSESRKARLSWSATVTSIKARRRNFLARRPHRSFKRTLRRDYERSLRLPGYIAFTNSVVRELLAQRKTFSLLILSYAVVAAVFSGGLSQSLFIQFNGTIDETAPGVFSGFVGQVEKSGLLLLTGAQGNFLPQQTDAQQVYAGLLFLLMWLTTIWLLRSKLAGRTSRLRDAIYNSGAPIVPTTLLTVLLIVQLVPAALAVVGYNAALATNLLANGALSFIVFTVAVLLIVLSLYLVTSTLIAMVVVTLPGMYPLQAMQTAGDLVIGRRLRILLRILWGIIVTALVSALVLFLAILFASWFQTHVPDASWIPIVPVVFSVVGSAAVIFLSAYIYLFYRKVVDDDSAPA